MASHNELKASLTKLFDILDISRENVPLALRALDRHSQNEIFYDLLKAKSITKRELKDGDDVFKFLGLPFDPNVSIEEFNIIMNSVQEM